MDYAYEAAYSDALLAVAMGVPRNDTRGFLIERYPRLEPDAIGDVLADAYRDARKQGVELEDIDESWHSA